MRAPVDYAVTKKYVPVLTEEEIVEEIRRRVAQLLCNRNEQPGKEAWIAWGEGEGGAELISLLQMLDASESYCSDEFKDEI